VTRVGAALVLALAALLAGCAGIPSTGPVERVGPVAPADRPPFVDVVAPGPQPGDTEIAIAEGFLLAMASYDPGYGVAREYLTAEAAARWRPQDGITVFDTTGAAQDASRPGMVRLDLPIVGRVAADGSYWRAVPEERQPLDLAMRQVDGEWRIVSPPEGVVMTSFDFDREFRSYSRHLFDPRYEVLVPDPVLLPRTGNLTTLLASALLSGPSRWLAPAVKTAVPEGTALGTPSVPVELGVARVDLTAPAAAASPQARDRMAAQLAWTLAQVDGVEAVQLTVGGAPLVLPDAADGVRRVDADPQYDPAVIGPGTVVHAIVDGRAVSVGQGDPEPVPGPFGAEVALRSVAVAVDGRRLAGVTSDGRRLLAVDVGPAGQVVEVAVGSDLSAPSFDRLGVLWAVERRPSGGVVVAFGLDGSPVPVRLEPAAPVDVLAVRPSLDGTRAALLVRSAQGAQAGGTLATAIVQRTDEGIVLSGIRSTQASVQDVVDVAWYSPTSVALLAEAAGTAGHQPYVLDVAVGEPVARGPVVDAVSLAAAPGRQLVVATEAGRLLRQDVVLRWGDIGAGAAPAYPG
jgi:hypothetical protein